jgi:hypothetical protein
MHSAKFITIGRLVATTTLVTAAASAQGERAIVAGAPVAIRNVTTNVISKTTTNLAGIYYLTSLPPGRYERSCYESLSAGARQLHDLSLDKSRLRMRFLKEKIL